MGKLKHPWEPGYRDRYDESWFRQIDYETQQRYMAQDQARVQMHNRVRSGAATEHDFSALCIRQARENLAGLTRRASTPDQVRNAMGVTATERKPQRYEDDAEVRRDAVALGLIPEA